MTTLETVQKIYAAFAQRDLAGILEHFAEDIEWDTDQTGEPAKVPWLAPRRGRSEIHRFFVALAAEVEFERFEPRNFFVAADGSVADLFYFDAIVRRTGERISDPAAMHLWRFNPQGKVIAFRHVGDTWQHVRAWQKAGLPGRATSASAASAPGAAGRAG